MNQRPGKSFGDFLEGKGFYIVLILCVTAIGISGYYLFSGLVSGEPYAAVPDPGTEVVAPTEGIQVPIDSPTVAPTPPTGTGNAPGVPTEDGTDRATTGEDVSESATDEAADEETATEDSEDEDGATETAEESETEPHPASTIFTWPVKGEVLRDFSLEVFAYDATMGDWRTHSGLDIEAALGTEVMAVSLGVVSEVKEDPLLGSMVVIDHIDGVQSVYANLTAVPTVTVGEEVTPGAIIGAVGETAVAESMGPSHLHFEMKQNGIPVDPVSFFPEEG